jgi:ankyrin repeat protein
MESDEIKRLKSYWTADIPAKDFLNYRNERNETVLHLVCQNLDVELATILLDYSSCMKLLGRESLCRKFEFREFLSATSESGETALYQCLQRLQSGVTNVPLNSIVELFINDDVTVEPNAFVNTRVGRRTTFLHLLIEREQIDLVETFVDFFESCFDYNDAINYTVMDFYRKTPLRAALETGNRRLVEFLHGKSRKKLSEAEILEAENWLKYSAGNDDCQRFRTLVQNKFLITPDEDNPLIKSESFYRVSTNKIDISSFDALWRDYLVLAKRERVRRVKKEQRQMLINRVNKHMSNKYSLVVLIGRAFQSFDEFNNFIKYLPFNFKIILVGQPNLTPKFDFYLKTGKLEQCTLPGRRIARVR